MQGRGRILDEFTDNVAIGCHRHAHAARPAGTESDVKRSRSPLRAVLMMAIMLVLGLLAARHPLQVLLDLAGQLIHLRG